MIPTKELSKDGPRGKNELYALYSEARHRFAEATTALIGATEPHQAKAGIRIFTAAINALNYFAVADILPTFNEVKFDDSIYDAVFPPPILSTLGYFKSVPLVSLTALNFKPLHNFDKVALTYPHSVLRDQDTLVRFFADLIKVYTQEDNPFPLLLDPDVRAYQICRYCDRALGQELERIGEPLHAQIFLPGN